MEERQRDRKRRRDFSSAVGSTLLSDPACLLCIPTQSICLVYISRSSLSVILSVGRCFGLFSFREPIVMIFSRGLAFRLSNCPTVLLVVRLSGRLSVKLISKKWRESQTFRLSGGIVTSQDFSQESLVK